MDGRLEEGLRVGVVLEGLEPRWPHATQGGRACGSWDEGVKRQTSGACEDGTGPPTRGFGQIERAGGVKARKEQV